MRPRSFTDDELLRAARRLFLESGPGVSTARIAQALGVSQAALFKRFATKQALMMRALLPEGEPEWLSRLRGGPDDRPVHVQLVELATEIDAFFSRMMPALSIIRAAGVSTETMLKACPGEPLAVRAHRALSLFFEILHGQGRAHVPAPRAAAGAFLAAVHGRHTLRHALGALAPDCGEDYAAEVASLFWRGARPLSVPQEAAE